MKSSEVLKHALGLLEGGTRWTKNACARSESGHSISVRDVNAHSFCSIGAVNHFVERGEFDKAFQFLDRAAEEMIYAKNLGLANVKGIIGLNDFGPTEFATIEKTFNRAIDLAQAAGD